MRIARNCTKQAADSMAPARRVSSPGAAGWRKPCGFVEVGPRLKHVIGT